MGSPFKRCFRTAMIGALALHVCMPARPIDWKIQIVGLVLFKKVGKGILYKFRFELKFSSVEDQHNGGNLLQKTNTACVDLIVLLPLVQNILPSIQLPLKNTFKNFILPYKLFKLWCNESAWTRILFIPFSLMDTQKNNSLFLTRIKRRILLSNSD